MNRRSFVKKSLGAIIALIASIPFLGKAKSKSIDFNYSINSFRMDEHDFLPEPERAELPWTRTVATAPDGRKVEIALLRQPEKDDHTLLKDYGGGYDLWDITEEDAN